ncbi:MAG: hypothetical protein U1D31_01400 [Patescibacteria group bacterium]|nr:FtsQ-type POTRA domain-containing protein [bacterium]MDZ4240763.1 hypothetical protein [Patescibacteria group bacterium]
MFKRRALHSVRRAQKRKKELTARVLFIVFLVAAISASTVFILRNDFFLLRTVTFEGNTVTTDEELTRAVFESLKGTYIRFIPQQNVLLYPKEKIEPYLLSAFPRLERVSVRLSGTDSLAITLAERAPSAMWCGESKTNSVPCYFVDKWGFIFSIAPEFSSSDVYVKYYGAVSESPLGQTFLPDSFSRVDSFVQSLRQINLSPVTCSIDEKGDGVIALENKSELLFNPSEDLSVTFENLTSFLRENQKEFSQKPFTYIDLRFGNKIFYKP